MAELSDRERTDWLRLIRTRNVGPATFADLITQFGSAREALTALPDLARRGGRRGKFTAASQSAAEDEIAATDKLGAVYIAACEPAYPPRLAACDAPPPLICVKGNIHLLRQPAIAIVGARNASAAGIRHANDLAHDLGGRDLQVVSGLARGVDTSAHNGAIETGTWAVLAGGIDVIYPPQNAALHERIAEVGVLMTEMPPGTEPQARQFPRRNRLISGVSLGVVVVEAALRSGSLITARFAAEQGREVFAVPGSPLDPRSRGGNELIRNGATLVENADHVVEGLANILRQPLAEPSSNNGPHRPPPVNMTALDAARPDMLEKLGPTPVAMDELIRQTGLPTAVVAAILLELEIAGRLERHPGQRVSLI